MLYTTVTQNKRYQHVFEVSHKMKVTNKKEAAFYFSFGDTLVQPQEVIKKKGYFLNTHTGEIIPIGYVLVLTQSFTILRG